MVRNRRRRFTLALVAGLLAAPTLVTEALAQAWVPARGEGAVAIAFQTMNFKKHLATTTPIDAGPIDTHVLLTDLSFGLTDKVAVDLALPFVTSKYTGAFPHPGTNVDDGHYRSAFTDVRFALRYNLTRIGAVVTPYIGTIVPSHSYGFYGHAAPGQQLREIQVGVYVAKLLDRGLPGLFISGRYGYGFLEKVADIPHNRSMGDLEVGYFFSPRFRAFTSANAGYSHGGIDFPANGLAGLPPALRPNHDQIQKVHHLDLGAGAAFSITDSFDVFGSFSRLIAGRNGHALNRGITVGGSWSFSRKSKQGDVTSASAPASAPEAVTASARDSQPSAETAGTQKRSLVRCICQKSGS